MSGSVRHGTNAARGLKAARPSLWLMILSLVTFITLIALGSWQIQRREWKLALIERVDQRIDAPAVDIPSQAAWPAVTATRDEYRHVTVTGRFLHDQQTLVKAVTEEGGGYWVLTPLRRDDGTTVLINRGFIPADRREASARHEGEPLGTVTITGLLRITEPKGGFLRSNDSVHDRWYSRDVTAIAAARRTGSDAGTIVEPT